MSNGGLDFVNDPDVETETDGPVDFRDDQRSEQDETDSSSPAPDFVNDPSVETETDGPVDFRDSGGTSSGSSDTSGTSRTRSSSGSSGSGSRSRPQPDPQAEERALQTVEEQQETLTQAERNVQDALDTVRRADTDQRFEVTDETARQIEQETNIDLITDNIVTADRLQEFYGGQLEEVREQRQGLEEFEQQIQQEDVASFEQTEQGIQAEFVGQETRRDPIEAVQEENLQQELRQAETEAERRDIAGEILIREGLSGIQERTETIQEERSGIAETFGAGLSITREALSDEGGVFQVLTDEERRQMAEEEFEEDEETVAGLQSGIEGLINVGEEADQTSSPVEPGPTTLLLTGGAVRATGEITGQTPETREFDLREGVEEFTGGMVEQARDDPVGFGFVAAVDTATAAGVTRAATAAGRPARAAARDPPSLSEFTGSSIRGQASITGGRSRPDAGPSRTPGPARTPGPRTRDTVDIEIDEQIVTPDPQTEVNTVFGGARPETSTQTTSQPDTISREETRTEAITEEIDQDLDMFGANTISQGITSSRDRVDAIATSRAQAQTTSRTQATTAATTTAQATADTFTIRPRPRMRGRPRRSGRRRRFPPFGAGTGDSSEEEIEEFFGQPDVEISPRQQASLDALLTGQTGEQTDETLTGFETRPIPENNDNQELNMFF